MNKMCFRFLHGLAASVASAIAFAKPYDFADDFSRTTNPNGPWSYGWTATSGGVFDPYNDRTSDGGIELWNDTGEGKSESLAIEWYDGSNAYGIVMAPNEYALHPGPNGEYSVARFVAPTAGVFSLDAAFDLVDSNNVGSVDTDVRVKGVSLGRSSIVGYGSSKAYSVLVTLAKNDVVDFVVDDGIDGSFIGDSTRLRATITPVPEPTSFATIGLGALTLLRRRARRG